MQANFQENNKHWFDELFGPIALYSNTRCSYLIFFELIFRRILPLTLSAHFLQVSLWFVQTVLSYFVLWLVSFESGLDTL